jgi:hypothetical protein
MGKRGKRRSRRSHWSEAEQRYVSKKRNRGGRQKMSEAKRNFKERAGWQNRHHDKARSLGGTYADKNIIMLDERRHAALHLVFALRSMFQIAEVCLRMHDMKNGTKHKIVADELCNAVC